MSGDACIVLIFGDETGPKASPLELRRLLENSPVLPTTMKRLTEVILACPTVKAFVKKVISNPKVSEVWLRETQETQRLLFSRNRPLNEWSVGVAAEHKHTAHQWASTQPEFYECQWIGEQESGMHRLAVKTHYPLLHVVESAKQAGVPIYPQVGKLR